MKTCVTPRLRCFLARELLVRNGGRHRDDYAALAIALYRCKGL
jgi:hypothetical protein